MTKTDKVAALLRQRRGRWVPMPSLAWAAGTYVVHSEIDRCRKRGMRISNKREGRDHSFYRLEREAS